MIYINKSTSLDWEQRACVTPPCKMFQMALPTMDDDTDGTFNWWWNVCTLCT